MTTSLPRKASPISDPLSLDAEIESLEQLLADVNQAAAQRPGDGGLSQPPRADAQIAAPDPADVLFEESIDLDELKSRVARGDRSARLEVTEALSRQSPGAIRAFFGDLAYNVTEAQIDELSRQDGLAAEAIRARLTRLRRELGAGHANPFENLLIEDVAGSWLALMTAEDDSVTRHFNSPREREHFFAIRDRAHRRFILSMKTLAQVRKLALPSVQVNIAQKQVNVAGMR